MKNLADFLNGKIIVGRSVNLRQVCEKDAEFILSLRCDEKKARFLNKTENDPEKQRAYIAKCLKKPQEWYFIIENKGGEALGTIRIYDVRGDDFHWGSWLIKDGAPTQTALESMLLMYDFAFYTLKFAKTHLDIRKSDRKTWSFHKSYGAKFEREDEIDVFYSFCKEDYEKIREKFYKFIS